VNIERRPRIGITLEVGQPDEKRRVMELPADYAKSVIRAGGLPLLLPFTSDTALRQEMIELVDALIVPGGNDIDPALYGQERHEKTKLTAQERTEFDLAMLSLAEQRKMPTLGICLGCQIMNVHRKGTLHQHLPDVTKDLEHRVNKDRSNRHEVKIEGKTRLFEMLQLESLPANSRHHQAIDRVGRGLQVTAHAPDGVIEAVEDPTLPFWVAVQWHPENLFDSPHERLFQALVNAAREYRARRATR
jgi:putative glutamine amidotransferase